MKKCEVCGADAHPPWKAHVFGPTKPVEATNKEADISPSPATNKARTANRRDRKAYNAYQREYMKRRRAKT